MFILLDASLEGGTLKVFVDLNREKEPQWFDDPLLLTGTEPLKGAMSGGRAPYAIVFEGVSGDLRESMIEFPKVTVKIDKTTTQSASATTLQGPEGELLTVTGRETTPNGFIIHYAPPTQYGPMVAKAVICAGDRRIRSSGSGGTFSPDPQKSEGSIVFPSEARSLSDAEGAMIEVESFFRVVRVLVPVVLATDGK